MIPALEEWRPISQVRGYDVSRSGMIRHAQKMNIKKQTINGGGYPVVGLWYKGNGTVCYVHDLVAVAFNGPKPKGFTVNHIDGNKRNNVPSNLEYITLRENTLHQHRTGLSKVRGSDNGHAKLTQHQVLEIRSRARNGERTGALANEFGVGSPIISQIKHGSRWRHLDHLE